MTDGKHGGSDGHDPEGIKQELFTAWQALHPGGTRQAFDDELVALTTVTRPSLAENHVPRSWDDDPNVIKRRMFEEWMASRPGGTRAQFEAEWSAVTAAF
jgi:hypothetical protein